MTYIPLINVEMITEVGAFAFLGCIVIGIFEVAFKTEKLGDEEE